MELSEPHKAQVARFIAYFKSKRERLVTDMEGEKSEFRSDRLSDSEAIFNHTDVCDMLDAYHAQMVGSMRESVGDLVNGSAVYVAQVLVQAEQHGVVLDQADVSAAEDQNLCAQLAQMVATGSLPVLQKKHTGNLPTLGAGAAVAADPNVAAQLQALQSENEQMQQRYQLMQSQVTTLLQERTALTSELERVGAQVPVQAPIENFKDSNQFRELKAILKKKSEEVKTLRDVLVTNGLPLPGTEGGIELQAEDN